MCLLYLNTVKVLLQLKQKKFTNMKREQKQNTHWSVLAPPLYVSHASGSRPSSTANRTVAGSSCRNDGNAARPDLRVTSHRRWPPSLASASRSGTHLQPPGCRRRCRSAGPSLPGRRPSPGPDPLLLLWDEVYSVDTEDTGSTPGATVSVSTQSELRRD